VFNFAFCVHRLEHLANEILSNLVVYALISTTIFHRFCTMKTLAHYLESFVVNLSARHCKRCRKKIQHALTAVETGGVGAAVDASAGGGTDKDAVHDLARATSDVLGLQLLQPNMSLQRALKQSRKELDRHGCVYMTSYALLPSFSLSPSVLCRSVLCARALQHVTPTRVLSFCILHARVPCAYHAYPQATSFVSTQ